MNTQDDVIKILQEAEDHQATLQEIQEQLPKRYFYNGRKHVGDMMARMVNNGKVERIKPGLFRMRPRYSWPVNPKAWRESQDPRQTSLQL